MGGRIVRNEPDAAILELPEIGRLHIGKKQAGQNGREYPVSVDYFIPSGKYAGMFTAALGEKPQTIQVIFPDDSPEKVCNERYEYRDDKGALVARGDGRVFEIWDGKKYAPYSIEQFPDIMQQVTARNPKKTLREDYDGHFIDVAFHRSGRSRRGGRVAIFDKGPCVQYQEYPQFFRWRSNDARDRMQNRVRFVGPICQE